ncbi:MAG TPA: hypothetical protein VF018_05100 [Acidobacteriaceae bacterium]
MPRKPLIFGLNRSLHQLYSLDDGGMGAKAGRIQRTALFTGTLSC